MNWGLLLGIAGSLLAVWLALIVLLWVLRPRDVALAQLVRVVPDVLRLVRRLIGDPSTPFLVRAALVGLLLWLINPIDLVPEFVPVLGPLDDVVVAVIVLRFASKRLGTDVMRARWPGTEDGFALLSGVVGGQSASTD